MRKATLALALVVMRLGTLDVSPAAAQGVTSAASIVRELTPRLKAPASDDGSVVVSSTRGVKLHPAEAKPQVSLIVLFATGSAELTGDGKAQLDQVGMAMKDPSLSNAHFRIEGHTDTTGDAKINQVLSEQRARAVVDYLVAQHGLDRGKFRPVGLGKQGLAVQTPDQTDEPRNRRVVLVNLDG